MTDRDLVARIARAPGGKAGYKQLVRELGLGGGRERRLLLEQLARLTASGRLARVEGEMWAIPQAIAGARDNLVAGRLDLHRDGYGFVRPNPERRSAAAEKRGGSAGEDIFIPPGEINGAMQGDQVLVELDPPKADGRRQGRIARVLTRRNATVVGTFRYGVPGDRNSPPGWDRARGNTVLPFDERMRQPILIPLGAERPQISLSKTPHRVLGSEASTAPKREGLEGLVVDVEITQWPTATRPAMGRVIEVLGLPDDFGVDVEMMIRKHQLPRIFPEEVLAEARAVAHLDPTGFGVPHPRRASVLEPRVGGNFESPDIARRDFRALPIVTIDGETARDFDDAVLVRERAHSAGYELQVHIADVSEYVRPDSALDAEARLRGTSVYFPDRAIPMLPLELSTDICSLRPQEDRLVLSCIMQLDASGRIESYEIVEGVIRSAARMTYTAVSAILEGDAETLARYAKLVPDFETMKKLAVLMNQRREQRGSIDFDLPEPVIEFDARGEMRGITRAERTWANRLIEEFMLAANECVATWLEDLGVPSLYRIHEKPEARRVIEFEEIATSFGFSLGLGPLPVRRLETRAERREARGTGSHARRHEIAEEISVTPKMYQKLAARIEGKPEERILSYLMLRSLKQARYSETNEGHFALAAPTYTHFTSPIRRYPDLIVHRIAKTLLRAGVPGAGHVPEGRHSSPWTHPHEGGLGSPVSQVRQSGPFHKLRAGSGAPKVVGEPPIPEAGAPHPRESAGRARVGHPPSSVGAPSFPRGMEQTERKGWETETPIPEAELAQIAEECSQTERRAAEAERELVEWKKVRFMQDRVGDEFNALVLNPAKFGLFVELTDLFVEGLVPIDRLRGDRYVFRESSHEIVGERWGRRFRAGDRVEVVLERILAQERKLEFSLVEEGIPLTGRKQPKPAPKKKKKKDTSASSPAPRTKRHSGRRGRRR
jgi:ribonuclease R